MCVLASTTQIEDMCLVSLPELLLPNEEVVLSLNLKNLSLFCVIDFDLACDVGCQLRCKNNFC